MTWSGIIAVHVGAGSHSSSLRSQYKKLMRDACREASVILKNKGSALDAVSCATKILEDSHLTNAGNGSSLTRDGTVECDATIMDGDSLRHGSVGAASGVQNPILLARRILDSQKYPLPGGLVPPSFLAGSGARDWAVSHDVEVCQTQSLITDKSKQLYEESIKYINQLEEKNGKKRKLDDDNGTGLKSELLDTVGAVCVDLGGNVASTVSSGGILLKHSGRIGQAAVYGCGCWAQNDFEKSGVNIAVSTSGCGEHLIKTTFGRLCAHSTLNTDPLGTLLVKDIQEKFLDSEFLKEIETPMGGSLSLRHDPVNHTTDLFWLHTTRSMGVAYMASSNTNPQALFSELPVDRVGRTVAVNCKSFSERSSEQEEEDDECEETGEEDEGIGGKSITLEATSAATAATAATSSQKTASGS